jgi:hypothetical protein
LLGASFGRPSALRAPMNLVDVDVGVDGDGDGDGDEVLVLSRA